MLLQGLEGLESLEGFRGSSAATGSNSGLLAPAYNCIEYGQIEVVLRWVNQTSEWQCYGLRIGNVLVRMHGVAVCCGILRAFSLQQSGRHRKRGGRGASCTWHHVPPSIPWKVPMFLLTHPCTSVSPFTSPATAAYQTMGFTRNTLQIRQGAWACSLAQPSQMPRWILASI